MKKKNLNDLEINFNKNIYLKEFDLIKLLKTNFTPKKIFFLKHIDCGGSFSLIYNKSFLLFFIFIF
jgi:hypothetical protein